MGRWVGLRRKTDRPTPLRKVWLVLALLAIVVGGGLFVYPPGRIELDRRRAGGEASLRAIESLRGELPGISKEFSEDTVFKPGGSGKLSPQNTAFVHAEDLSNLAVPAPMVFRYCESQLKQAASLVRTSKWPDGGRLSPIVDWPDLIDSQMDYLGALRYVFIIRKQRYDPPQVLNNGRYDAGTYWGDALLFQIRPQKFLGKIWISGSNRSFMVEGTGTAHEVLITDLQRQVRSDLDAEVSRRFPAFGTPSSNLNLTCAA